jgi:hypothetical protein
MSERNEVPVDENRIQRLIAGEVALYTPKQVLPDITEKQETPEEPAEMVEPVEPSEPVKKPKERKRSGVERSDFAELFLKDNRLSDRRIVYVSKETYEKLIKYVSIITDRKLGLVGYVDNVLSHHIETYKSEINDLFESKLGCKVFKNNV